MSHEVRDADPVDSSEASDAGESTVAALVRRLPEATSKLPGSGTILDGPRKPHSWPPPPLPERINQMADYAAANAPRDADRSWWRD